MNCTAEKQLSHGVFESFEIRKDSFFTVPQCEDTAPIQIGEILDNTYLITRFIAQGGMGIVYEGIDLVLHRKVAIKVLVTDFDNEEYEKELKLFQTEINLCGNLRHPNVIQIYYSGIHHRLPYLVMEYIEGIPINEYVMKQRRFNWNQKVKLISQVASGLAYIHKNNILHRDIKPSNILVKADGTPVLIDFGISIKKNLATVATSEGELSGTIHYMSPEQVAGEYDKINERSDIYSLGLILYELLIKRPAYTGSPNEIIGQIFNSSLLPPSDVNINISETLSNITMKAIAKEPEDRYSTATEFIEDLRLYLKNGNNKPIINKVPLWQKAFCYLKPNTATAISLIWIAFFFIIVAITPLRKYIPENITGYLRTFISNSSNSFLAIFYPQEKITQEQGSVNSGKENIQEPEEPQEPQEPEEPQEPQEPTEDDSLIEILTEKEQKTNTSNQIAQATQPSETIQSTVLDNKPTKTQNSNGITHFNVIQENPEDTPTQTSKPKLPPTSLPGGFNIEVPESPVFLPGPINSWTEIECKGIENIDYSEIYGCESSSNQYLFSDKKGYIFTPNENNSTLTVVDEVPNIDCNQKPYWENDSIIWHLSIDENEYFALSKKNVHALGSQSIYYFSLPSYLDGQSFDGGQCFLIGNTHYFLLYNTNILYQLSLEKDTEENEIPAIQLDLKYTSIKNTSIIVLKGKLYYLGYYWDDNSKYHSGLCEVEVSGSRVISQKLIYPIDIEKDNPKPLVLVTDHDNRIWIIRYNPENQNPEKAVAFYSKNEDALYFIVNQKVSMLKLSTKEKILASEDFTTMGSAPVTEEAYEVLLHPKTGEKFSFVDESHQIALDERNNNKFYFFKASNEYIKKICKKLHLRDEKDNSDVIGMALATTDCREYCYELKKLYNVQNFSVLIGTEDKQFKTLDECKEYCRQFKFYIPYKGENREVPCFPFWCIKKFKKLQSNEKFQDYSKWLKKYSLLRKHNSRKLINKEEIKQFNYLDENYYEISVGFRPMLLIPNE